ncbi:hypothetical protein [uncultured Metabacillus sp.]|nr:hypothetical protein [uncultured Metabacillus sp.]
MKKGIIVTLVAVALFAAGFGLGVSVKTVEEKPQITYRPGVGA